MLNDSDFKIAMKVNRLEAHDRLLEVKKQSDYISKGCQDCIDNRPKEFGKLPFYIFAHTRTADDGFRKRLLWMPRLTKPLAEANSMLFKYYPEGDSIKIVWMIPERSMWNQYNDKNVTESKIVKDSIAQFQYDKKSLEKSDDDDLSEERAKEVYREIARNKESKLRTSAVLTDS